MQRVEPRLLIITRNAWADEISTGNTMSNFFSGWKYDIANVFCRDEKINNSICKKYYQITERELLKSIIKSNSNAGRKIIYDNINQIISDNSNSKNIATEEKKYDFFRKHRLIIFLWIRELIWKLGKWKNQTLNDFLSEIDPNVILVPLYDCAYMYDLAIYIQKQTNARVIIYTGDDVYTLKQLSLSPLFWINRFICRGKIRKLIKLSDIRICLTDKQRAEYSRIFRVNFTTCMKSANIAEQFTQPSKIKRMVYTGNLIPGRYKILLAIAKSVAAINKNGIKIEFHIYSSNRLSDRLLRKFVGRGINFGGSISKEEVIKVQETADILVHAEDFALRNKLKTRLSFSTKIIDYLSKGKCVLAVGPSNIASMEYLKQYDAAAVVNDVSDIEKTICKLIENENIMRYYARNALNCCKKNHNKRKQQERLYSLINNIINDVRIEGTNQ